MSSSVVVSALMLAAAPVPVQNFTGVMDKNPEVMCSLAVDEPRTPYGFAEAVLNSLSYARDGVARADEIPLVAKTVSEPTALMTEWLRISKTSSDDYLCAQAALSRFNQPGVDPTVRLATQNMLLALHQHIDLDHQSQALIKRMSSVSPPELADEMSTMQVRRAEIFRSIMPTVQIALLSLEDDQRLDSQGNINRLQLTSAQKKELIDRVARDFPELTTKSEKDQSFPATLASFYLILLKSHLAADE